MKKKKVIRKNRRHGKRGKAHALHPLCVEVAEAFLAIRSYYNTLEVLKDKEVMKRDYVESFSSDFRDNLNTCIVALSKLAAGRGNPFPEIGRALWKIARPSPNTNTVIFWITQLQADHGEPPSYKDVCYALFGSNWTNGQEAFVRKVAREEGPPLKRLA